MKQSKQYLRQRIAGLEEMVESQKRDNRNYLAYSIIVLVVMGAICLSIAISAVLRANKVSQTSQQENIQQVESKPIIKPIEQQHRDAPPRKVYDHDEQRNKNNSNPFSPSTPQGLIMRRLLLKI